MSERGVNELDDIVHARVVADPDDDVGAAARRHALGLAPLLHGTELEQLVARVVDRAVGLGPLQPLLADPTVSEVMVNAGRDVWVERHGEVVRAGLELEPATVSHLIERVVAPLGRRIDRSSPIVDGRLTDGTRVHAVVPPVAIDGPCLTLRRFTHHALPLTAFASAAVAGLLRWAIDARMNVVVSGPTSAGKTTLLNALAAQIGPGERLITIEDAAELRLEGDHVVRLEARPPTQDGVGAITIRDLVRAALRMRPDRLVIGEVRGPEALDMVMALSTGHDGSLSTCHANSALDALRRLEVMVLQGGGELPLAAVRDVVQAAIDLVVHVSRGAGGQRRVVEVVEVLVPDTGSGSRVRRLASGDVVVAQPTRAGRRAGDAPSDGWWSA
jgi:pilus assembly protein CpaF